MVYRYGKRNGPCAVVHGIIKSPGGAVSVESTPRKATTFNILLPQAARQTMEKKEDKETLLGGSVTVLLVDDEDMLLIVGKKMLESLGYRVVALNSSTEAVESFRKEPNKFDIVITDQTMPYMTGFNLARELMNIRPEIPIILCTGYSETVSEEKARAAGIKDFLLKPIERREIAVKVKKILNSKF